MAKQNQTMLTAFFLALMLAGFGAVAYVSEMYTINAETESLFITDSDTDFPVYEYDDGIGYRSLQTSMSVNTLSQQYNKTAIYTGNNSYSIAMNSTTGDYVNGNIVMDISNIDNWIISDIIFNMTENDDDSYKLSIWIMSFDVVSGNAVRDSLVQTEIYSDYDVGTGDWKNESVPVSLFKAVSCNNNAQNHDKTIMFIHYYDDGTNYDSFAWNFKVEIIGEQISAWGLTDSITAVLIVSAVANIIIGIYMTDSIDMGGYVKDLRKKSKRRS